MNETNNQAISDDQELAKVLQGMQQQNHTMATRDPAGDAPAAEPSMQYEETPAAKDKDETPVAEPPTPLPAPVATEPSHAVAATPAIASSAPPPAGNTVLEGLKKEALEELRPLVSKLDLPPKEKFDTMLLIIRSTDDQELLQPAHEAAKSIESDTERAEALLDIIKEIDYFAGQKNS